MSGDVSKKKALCPLCTRKVGRHNLSGGLARHHCAHGVRCIDIAVAGQADCPACREPPPRIASREEMAARAERSRQRLAEVMAPKPCKPRLTSVPMDKRNRH